MSVRDLIRPNRNTAITSKQSEILSRYKRLRKVNRRINDKLVSQLSSESLDEGAKKLGILQKGILVFEREEELDMLMDYCIYNIHINGRNAVEKYLIDSPPHEDSDEMVCLRAMQHAIFSLIVVESVEPGSALTVRNMVSN